MQISGEDIKAIKNVLGTAEKVFMVDDFDRKEFGNLYDNVLSCFSYIGKEKLIEFAPEVKKFLKSENVVLRESAVVTLGLSSRLHLPEFRETAYQIWLDDEDDCVKEAALRSWISYYDNTQNVEVLKTLYSILTNENYTVDARMDALEGIFSVSGEEPIFYVLYSSYFFDITTHEEIKDRIDWDKVNNLMKKYAPEALSQN